MRHYYNVYCLLHEALVIAFIGTPEYTAHKTKRFRSEDNPDLAVNQAFLLSDPATRKEYARAYDTGRSLYYQRQPKFDDILEKIKEWVDRL